MTNLILSDLAATEKYRTPGLAGVEGLKTLLQKLVVRSEYAGASNIPSRRVVRDAGRAAS